MTDKTQRNKPARDKRDSDSAVQSLLRAIQLLEVLAEDDDGYRLVDLAVRTGLSTSTVHRLLTTLEQTRFVQFDQEHSLWHIGVQCFATGSAFARRRNLAMLAQPVMRRLRDQTGETVNLLTADQGYAVFLMQVESRELMRAIARPGSRAPLHCTAGGLAILAALDEQELDRELAELLPLHGLPRMTPNSIARPTRLREVLADTRRQGYALDDEQNALGLRCVSAPVFNELGRPFAAISVSGPTLRVTSARLAELGRLVIAAAADVTKSYGGRKSGL